MYESSDPRQVGKLLEVFSMLKVEYPFTFNIRGLRRDKEHKRSEWMDENFGKRHVVTRFGFTLKQNERFIKFDGHIMFRYEEDALLFKFKFL